jgi:hypothetical protein
MAITATNKPVHIRARASGDWVSIRASNPMCEPLCFNAEKTRV